MRVKIYITPEKRNECVEIIKSVLGSNVYFPHIEGQFSSTNKNVIENKIKNRFPGAKILIKN